ncbi:MAG: hypothetical protein ABFD44_12170 [Anaerolineaceae bacterium]
MERTVPNTASDEIDLYLRTVYSLLRSTTEIQVRTLEEVHAGMNSSLHPGARKTAPDPSAFIYSLLRLPDVMPKVERVILGQSTAVFAQHGYPDVESWKPVSARARRRRCYYGPGGTLACFIASQSDIEDVIPSVTAYQIEWNKIHRLLQQYHNMEFFSTVDENPDEFSNLAEALEMSPDDLARLSTVWGGKLAERLREIASHPCSFRIHLLAGSLSEYWRATRAWWENIEAAQPALLERPVYLISSNTHSVANLLSGFALKMEGELLNHLEQDNHASLRDEWRQIQQNGDPRGRENFLYYLLKRYQQTPNGKSLVGLQFKHEQSVGISRIQGEHTVDMEAQVIDLSRLNLDVMDSRLCGSDYACLRESDALILNIDYPLGMAAYNVLAKVAEHCSPILGVYFMGKAATLNGVMGDVMIPNVVHDEHSHNTYLFQNMFTAADVAPYLLYGSVFDNQKSLTVLGTFLQNARVMDVIYREGYTDVEMEAGPYLSAVYEMFRPKRHPVNEIVNLYGLPFDLGVLHYVSDTPMSKGKNLGAGTLSYYGMDSTYATSVAILRRIFMLEKKRLKG